MYCLDYGDIETRTGTYSDVRLRFNKPLNGRKSVATLFFFKIQLVKDWGFQMRY